MNIFHIILFYLIYSLVSYVIIYSGDTVDIANDDFEPQKPSINDLSEEERKDYCTLDSYIKKTICPSYHHQILKEEIDYYQKGSGVFVYLFLINFTSCIIPIKILNPNLVGGFMFSYLIALILGFVCSFIVWLLYKKYSPHRIKSFCNFHSSQDWESHYNYLLYIKGNIIFRYVLRKVFARLSLLYLLLFMFITYNIF